MCRFNCFSPGQKAIHVGITRRFMKAPDFCPSPRNERVATIGLEAIVSELLLENLRAACARVNSMREFRLEIFCFTFRNDYVGIQTCMRTSF